MPNDRPPCPTCALREEDLADARDQLVALERLLLPADRGGVLDAIQDVVVNVVGSEELAIFEPDADGTLRVARALGVDGARLGPLAAFAGDLGRAVAERRAWIAGDPARADDPTLTAVVPLEARGRVVAVLAVWRLLGHKPALRETDRRVLGLLARHAGRALDAASREARS